MSFESVWPWVNERSMRSAGDLKAGPGWPCSNTTGNQCNEQLRASLGVLNRGALARDRASDWLN